MANDAYSNSGINYTSLDSIKRLAQTKAKETSSNNSDFKVIEESRGESAFVWDDGDKYQALVIEGLGTKNLITEEVLKTTGKSYFAEIAKDNVAMIINDLIVVGAKPMVLNAYFGLGDSKWLLEQKRSEDLINGYAAACILAGCVWGGGETPALPGIINRDTIDLAGCAVGVISPKERLILGDRIEPGDAIILIESNGIHANGLTLVRKIADSLPERFQTKLPSGQTLGESLLRPTYIYAKTVDALFNEGINIHYMANITGHGFRKVMRANREFTYVIENLPEKDELFEFIKTQANLSDEEMYGTFNMGAGFAIILPGQEADKACEIIADSGFKAIIAGSVESGEKQVVIKPLDIKFSAETLEVR